jgi:PAS domain-containing protein
VRTGAELMWPHQNCEFQADWARPNGFEDGLFIRLTGAPLVASPAVATPRRPDPFDTAERVALVHGLVPHLQQALRTQYHLEDLSHRSSELAGASEAVRHGIVVVASDHRMVYSNSAAQRILRADDGLRIRPARIEAATLRSDSQLQYGVDRALTAESADRCGSSFLCARPSGRRPYVVHVLPLDETTFASPRPQHNTGP